MTGIKGSGARFRHVVMSIALAVMVDCASGTTYIERHLAEIKAVNHRIIVVYFPYEVGDILRRQEAAARKLSTEDTSYLIGEKTKAVLRSRDIEISADSDLGFFVSFRFEPVRCGGHLKIAVLVRAFLSEKMLLAREVLGGQESMQNISWSTERMVVVDEAELYQTIEDEALSTTEEFVGKVDQARQFYLKRDSRV